MSAWNPTRWLGAPRSGGFKPAPGVAIAPHLRLVRPVTGANEHNVWVADQLVLQIEVAVKFTAPDPASAAAGQPPEELDRFLRQARCAARLSDPHLVQILEQGRAKGVPFLVMELLEGRSLRQRLFSTGPLSLQEALAVMSQAAGVLAKAHPLGLWHGNLCAEHLFASEAAGELFLKIANHGDLAPAARTHLSPEQVRHGTASSAAADLWALGVTMYELLTTILPFEAEGPAGVEAAIESAALSPPSSYRADISPALDAWFERVLARDPARRLRAPLELAREFARAVGGSSEVLAVEAGAAAAAPQPHGLAALGSEQDIDERTQHWEPPSEWGPPHGAHAGAARPAPPPVPAGSVPPPPPDRVQSARPPPAIPVRASTAPILLAELERAAQPGAFVPPAARPRRLSKTKGLIGGALLGGAGAFLAWSFQSWSGGARLPSMAGSAETRAAPLGTAEAAAREPGGGARPPREPVRGTERAENLPRIVQTDDLPQAPEELPEEDAEAASVVEGNAGAEASDPAPAVGTDVQRPEAKSGAKSTAKSVPGPRGAAAAAPASRAPPSRSPLRRSTQQVNASASCNPPYFFDKNNIQRIKRECL